MRSEIYTHYKQEHSIDLHRSDAVRLGFPDFEHTETIVGPNQSMIVRQKPLELTFYPSVHGGTLNTAHYRECKVCGKDHEALVIAFLEHHRRNKDGAIVNAREEKRKKWEAQGIGESLASDIVASGMSDEDIRRRLGLVGSEAQDPFPAGAEPGETVPAPTGIDQVLMPSIPPQTVRPRGRPPGRPRGADVVVQQVPAMT